MCIRDRPSLEDFEQIFRRQAEAGRPTLCPVCLLYTSATGMPVVSRCITVDGDACANPQNLIVPVGTSYEDVLNAAGLKRCV